MARNCKIASEWETATDADKNELKSFIIGIVGYPCKIACKVSEEGTHDIYVFSEKKKRVTDWIEIQESGAIGVIYDFYEAGVSTDRLETACETYNTANNLAFDEVSGCDDVESDSDESESDDDQNKNVEAK